MWTMSVWTLSAWTLLPVLNIHAARRFVNLAPYRVEGLGASSTTWLRSSLDGHDCVGLFVSKFDYNSGIGKHE